MRYQAMKIKACENLKCILQSERNQSEIFAFCLISITIKDSKGMERVNKNSC